MASAGSKKLLFGLNGQRIELSHVDPATTLLDYLRYRTSHKGAKLGCGEGGCGACVVLLSKHDAESKEIEEYSISSCLTLLCSIDGCSITTTEGLGNCKDGYHSIHERFAGFHASQCGYCTPGMCMSLFAALRRAEKKKEVGLSVVEAEKAIAGNLCRCTGYRPIVDVCKSFAGDVDLEDLGLNSFWKRNELPHPSKLPPYNPTAVSTFPQFLMNEVEANPHQNCHALREPTWCFSYKDGLDEGEERIWIRPSNLEEILDTLDGKHCADNEINHVKLVVGNTSAGIYKEINPRVFVDISNIPELQIIKRDGSGIEVGAAVTLSKLIEALEDKIMGSKNLVFKEIAGHLNKVASGFIRNTASIGGNLIMAQRLSFDSDVATILLGAGASVKIISTDRKQSLLTMEEFLERPSLDSAFLLLSVCIPSWNQAISSTEDAGCHGSTDSSDKLLFKTYRAAPRPLGNAVSYTNAAFLAQFSSTKAQGNYILEYLQLAFGAFGVKHAIRAKNVEEFLVGKAITSAILLEAIQMLKASVVSAEGTPKAAYRQSVAVGFLFDFLSPLVKGAAVPSNIMDEIILPVNWNDSVNGNVNDGLNSATRKSCTSKTLTSGKQTMELHNDYHPIGEPSSKIGAELQASGEAVYVNDIPSPENCLHGAFVYSENSLALVKNVDVKHALQSPRVISYISADDIPKQGRNVGVESLFGTEILFAKEVVECVGQPLGLMVADTWNDAKRAANKVKVDYDCEKLGSPILSIEDAIAKRSFFEVPECWYPKPIGDFAKGLLEADRTIESAEVKIGSQYYFYLETQTALAIPDEDQCMVIYSACQAPEVLQDCVAKCLGIPTHNVRVITKRVGGGFGGKAFRSIPIAVACAVAAFKLRHAVRMYLDRKTDMIITGGRHPIKANYTVGFKTDGNITALHVDICIDAGFSVDLSPCLPLNIITALKKYNWGALSFDFKVCKTNLPSKSAMRGPGDAQGSFIAESVIEHVASILGLDANDVREKNMHTFDSAHCFYGSSVEGPIGYTLPSIWAKLKLSSHFDHRMETIRKFNGRNRWLKRGLSLVPCIFEVKLTPKPARVTIFTDGSIAVEVGGIEMGQGLWTKVKQMTAYVLGQLWHGGRGNIMSKVRIVQADTISLAHGGYTAGSTTSEANCAAVQYACNILVERLLPIKKQLEKNSLNGVSWEDLIVQAKIQSINLSAQAYWVPDSSALQYLNYGVAASEVEVNVLTGATTILQTDIIYDCGRSLNPAVDLGQIEGAFVQGIGFFMYEEHVVDKNGKVVSDGTWTYKIPTIDTIPQKFNVEILSSSMHQKRIASSKASGEPPLLLAASVHCATRGAIKVAREELQNFYSTPNSNKLEVARLFRMDSPATIDVVKSLCGLNNVEHYLQHLTYGKRWQHGQ